MRPGVVRGDAALISVLAYAGLRPGEALALRCGDVGETTLLVEKALALGDVKDTRRAGTAPSGCSSPSHPI